MPVTDAQFQKVEAVSAAAFAAAMSAFAIPEQAHVAVAVSGGADSVALVLLANDWAKHHSVRVTALTVDHKLRTEAADEAKSVAAWMSARGLAHHTLTWDEGANVRHLNRSAQDAARDARYALLTDWARANACTHILLAHHADDQIETFFIRLSRGSGLQGLGCMDAQTEMRGIALLRPLLAFSKEQLVATCQAHSQAWIEDPSNSNSKYTRNRFRQARTLLESEGLTKDRLLATIKHLQRARDAIQQDVTDLQYAACIWNGMGVATLNAGRIFQKPDEVSLRVLSDVLRRAGGQLYGPRFERLERLHAKLKTGDVRTVTLHGCCVTRSGDALIVTREPSAIVERRGLYPSSSRIWDGRFEITAGDIPLHWRLRPYQTSDKAFWIESRESRVFDGIPATLRRTLPVIEDETGPVGMPHLNLWRPGAEQFAPLVAARFVG